MHGDASNFFDNNIDNSAKVPCNHPKSFMDDPWDGTTREVGWTAASSQEDRDVILQKCQKELQN